MHEHRCSLRWTRLDRAVRVSTIRKKATFVHISCGLNQGIQGSGIDRVQLFMDDTPMTDAELGFSD